MGLGGQLGGSSLDGALGGRGIQPFDTDLFTPIRTVLRQSIALMLAPLAVPANGGSANGYVKAIRSLPRPLKSDAQEELDFIWRAAQGQAPCILIALGRQQFAQRGLEAVTAAGDIEIAIYAISLNARDLVEGRLAMDVAGASSANADPGIEVMLEHISERLLGQDPDVTGIHEFYAVSEDEVCTGQDFTVWEQRYTTWVERVVNPDRAVTGLLQSIEGRASLEGTDPAQPTVDTVTTLGVR